jgi:hypothetical protein
MLKNLALSLISVYQGSLRFILPSACRFTPSCSEYAKLAIEKYGFLVGGMKACKRVATCHPLSGKSGFDPLI